MKIPITFQPIGIRINARYRNQYTTRNYETTNGDIRLMQIEQGNGERVGEPRARLFSDVGSGLPETPENRRLFQKGRP